MIITGFIHQLQLRNCPLFIFGSCNLVAALIFFVLTRFSITTVQGVNKWFKPFKFAMSIGIFSWTMGWYTSYLHTPGTVHLYNWATIGLLGFEVVYIALQAGRGQLSHYNAKSSFYSFLTYMMALAATVLTLWTGYIGLLFFFMNFSDLPDYYLWSIRIAILLFVVFAFEGVAMGARNAHTVGRPDGGLGLPVLKWSRKYGDLRIAHFVGMHALQVLPILSWYVLKNTLSTIIAGAIYGLLAIFTFKQAIAGKPLVRDKVVNNSNEPKSLPQF